MLWTLSETRTHPAAFLRVALASSATVQACTRLVKLARTLQKKERDRDYKQRFGNTCGELLFSFRLENCGIGQTFPSTVDPEV